MSGDTMRMVKDRESMENSVRSVKRTTGREDRRSIPTQMKGRMEQGAGQFFGGVRGQHYNWNLPARLGSLAYTQGNQMDADPDKERNPPYEPGYVVQQKLGVVRTNTRHSGGDNVVQRCPGEPVAQLEPVLFVGRKGTVLRQGEIFRAMKEDVNQDPSKPTSMPSTNGTSAAYLCIRDDDINVVGGMAQPRTGGLSVSPCIAALPTGHRPKGIYGVDEKGKDTGVNGTGKLPVWKMNIEDLGANNLMCVIDKTTHALVEPSVEMPIDTYKERIKNTKSNWKKV